MRRHRAAFTLIELLTVIFIIAMLMAILIPSLTAARQQAKANVCLSHLKSIGTGFSIYLNENEDQFPPFRLKKLRPDTETFYINSYGRRMPRWQWFIETDLGPVIDPVPFRLHANSFGDRGLGGGREGTTMTIDLFTCPTLDYEEYERDVRNGAYGYNYQYLGNTRQDTTAGRWDNFSVGRHRIRAAGSTVVVADSRGAGRDHGRHSYSLDPPRLAIERRAKRFGPNPDPVAGLYDGGDVPPGLDKEYYAYSPVETRHKNRGNILFADSHAQAMTYNELGYQLSDGTTPEGVRKDTPIPVHLPDEGTYTATNKLFNGEGVDMLAEEHRPTPPDP